MNQVPQIRVSSNHLTHSACKEKAIVVLEQVTTFVERRRENCKEEHETNQTIEIRELYEVKTLSIFISSGLFVKPNLNILTKHEFSILHVM